MSQPRWPPRSTPRAGSPARSRSGRGRCRTSTSTSTSSRPSPRCWPGWRRRWSSWCRDGTELLGGLEMGGIPIATVLSSPDRAAGAVRAQEGQGVRHLQARRGAGRRRPPGHAGRGRHHHRRCGPRRDERAARARRDRRRRGLRDRPQPGGREPAGRRRPRGPAGAHQGRPRRGARGGSARRLRSDVRAGGVGLAGRPGCPAPRPRRERGARCGGASTTRRRSGCTENARIARTA